MPEKTLTNKSHRNRHGRRNGNAPDADPAAMDAAIEQRQAEFTSSRGVTVRINGVSPFAVQTLGEGLREEWAEAGDAMPDPPTYEIELPGGDKETRSHDETTLRTDEEKGAWAAYLARAEEFSDELQERTFRLLFIRGVQTPPLEDGAEWIEEQKFIGLHVPAGKFERRLWWIKTELISSADEMIELANRILSLSGVGEGALRAARKAFRDQVEKSDRDAAGESAADGGGLVPQPNSVGGESSAGHGEVAE